MITSSLGMLAGSGAGAAFGAAIGSSVPLLGTAVGFVAGVAFDGAMGLAMAEENQNRSVGKGLQQIASHSLMGGLGTNQAKSMAGRLLSMADTDFGLRTDTNRTDIQENLLGFANAGGFETVRTSEEFEKTAKGVIENTRKVITTLRKTQEEAVTLMADLQREGLVDVQDMGNFAANIAAVGKVTGLGSSDVLNFARQGAEMFRGSGINMSGGMGMLTRGIQDTRDMMKNHDVGAALVREMGGLEQATIGRIEGNVNFMNSTVGLLSYANFQSGGAVGDRMGMMNNAAGMNITDVYAMQAKRDRDIADGTLSTQRIAQERILTQGNFTNYIKLFNDTHETDFFDDKDNMQGYYKYMVRNEMAPSEAAAQDLFINAFDARMSPENQRRRVIDAEIATLSKSQDASPVTQQ
ncbi:hypothetical protein H8D85_02545 [bacterium]|nr:hypothetical protein [bacterium]